MVKAKWMAAWLVVAGFAGFEVCAQDLAVTGLGFVGESKQSIDWGDAPDADYYALYRGNLREGRSGELDHRGYATMLETSRAADSERPLPGRAFYYVATGLARNLHTGHLALGPLDAPDGTPRARPDAACAERVFVDAGAPAGGDGLTWGTAYRYVADAMVHPYSTAYPVEIWIKGNVLDMSLPMADRGVRLRGGFLGNEEVAWKRAATTPKSICEADFDASGMGSCDGVDVLVDRMEFAHGASMPFAPYASGVTLRVVDSVLGRGSVITLGGPTDRLCGLNLVMDRSVVGGGLVSVFIEGGDNYDVEIHRSTLVGNNGPALELHGNAGLFGARGRFEVLACDITAEGHGVELRSTGVAPEGDSYFAGIIASSVIHGCDLNGVYMEVDHAVNAHAGPLSSELYVTLQQNTIVDNGGSGVRIEASRSGSTAHPEDYPAHARAWLHDNLITHNAAYGVSESVDDEGAFITSDAYCVGNDFWGPGKFYWDEGLFDLTTIAEINALAGSQGNWSGDPDYVDPLGGDFHLGAMSLAVDEALRMGPMRVPIDIDWLPRVCDAREDVGADERGN
jgi:hypothetical protein